MSELPEGWDQTLHAPWTAEQVAVINRFQREANIHPFTCGKCVPHATLVATTDGWICPNFCGYKQDWVPAYMADPVMLERMTPTFPWLTQERITGMGDEAKCCGCGRTVSYDTGFTITGTLAEGSRDSIHCPDCAPDTGKGYTLSDLQQMRTNSQAERAKYEMGLMDLVGPDVYFAVKGRDDGNPP